MPNDLQEVLQCVVVATSRSGRGSASNQAGAVVALEGKQDLGAAPFGEWLLGGPVEDLDLRFDGVGHGGGVERGEVCGRRGAGIRVGGMGWWEVGEGKSEKSWGGKKCKETAER